MKRIIGISLLIPSLFLGMGCNHIIENSTSVESSSDNPISEVISEPSLSDSKWGTTYSETIIGNLGIDIPYISAPNYDVVESEDDFGDPLIIIYLYFEESEIASKLEEYSLICQNEGYVVSLEQSGYIDPHNGDRYTYDVYFADKEIDDKLGIELQFLEGQNKGKECLGIFAYNYVVDSPYAWPTNLVTSLLGHDVPHLKDEGNYSYNVHINSDGAGGKYIDMIIQGVATTAEEDYIYLLEDAGYQVEKDLYDPETYEYMGNMAYDKDMSHVIQFGLSQYGLEIYIWLI